MSEFDLEEIDRLLSTTRSVRKRLDFDQPVDPRTILECVRIAVQAPSGSNTQPWRWLVVTEAATKEGLAQLYRSSFEEYERELLAGSPPPAGTQGRVLSSAAFLAANLERVPALVVPCLLRPLPTQAGNAEMAGLYGSILPSVWSFMLALRARELGACWTTLHLRREREAAALLGIPDSVLQVAMLPVGHYTGHGFRPAERKDAADVTYWEQWGHKRSPVES